MQRICTRRNAVVPAALVSLWLSVVSAAPARAVDGIFEISQAAVVAAGGFPYVAAAPGSYVLTSNLVVPTGSDGIAIGAANVTVDLNGFSITSGGGLPASGVAAAGVGNVTVRNGTIEGFGGPGISVGIDATVLEMRLIGNSGGIAGGFDCLIVENVVRANGGGPGVAVDRCKIENNIVADNGGVGIIGASNVIVHNQISGNIGGGILSFDSSTIDRNVIATNVGFGISDGTPFPPAPPPGPVPPPVGFFRQVITGNTINATAAGAGIAVGFPAVIRENNVSSNFADGIICGADCVISHNVVESNNLGLVGGGGVTTYAGSTVNDNTIGDNVGYGLALPVTAGYMHNTFNANGPGGPDVLPFAPAHPTSGFFNLCSGLPGPAPTCP